MDNLYIEPTRCTPFIELKDHEITIKGRSLPENPKLFYHSVKSWLGDYFEETTGETFVKIHLGYFNTASTKCIIDIIYMFEDAHKAGEKIKLDWYYYYQNENLLEIGEDFKNDITFEFNIIPVQEDLA